MKKKQNLHAHFLANFFGPFGCSSVCCHNLFVVVHAVVYYFSMINNPWGEQLFLIDSIKYTFSIGLHQDTCEVIFVKVGMMLDMTKLYKSSLNDLGLQ